MKHKALKTSLLLVVVLVFGLIVSPAMATTFTQITQPDAAYQASTTKIDISGLTFGSTHSSITDGTLTVSFNSSLTKLGPVPSGWATWSSPPWSENATPDVLFCNDTSLNMTMSQPVTTFGFELEPNPFQLITYDVDFILMSGPTIIGNITIPVHGSAGARLFAANVTGGSFDAIVINGAEDFAIAQVRYILTPPVEIDIKPGSYPNSINPKSKGVIPVAILGSDDFDVSCVDMSTVLFGPTGNETAPVHWAVEDVNGDGFFDVIMAFRTQDSGFSAGDEYGILTFHDTCEDEDVSAKDTVNIVPKGKAKGHNK